MTIEISRRAMLGAAVATAATRANIATAGQQSVPAPGPARTTTTKIALEEHFMLPDFVEYFMQNKQNVSPMLIDKGMPLLNDFGERRLSGMAENGVEFAVLSLSGPGVQAERDTETAVKLARKANDGLAEEIRKQPKRYGGFAHLAMQSPAEAAAELERCMTQLKFQGAMVNGQTNGRYLDDRSYDVFWERAAALGAPVYIHPANPADHPAMYEGFPELWGPVWSWAAETCNHALRLVFGGTFDRYPNAKVLLGHMGETLPIQLWRLDSRYPIVNRGHRIEKAPSEYVRRNIAITTAGVCDDAALRCAIDAMGIENVMFSIDYPFEFSNVAADWIEGSNIEAEARQKICRENARRILRLS